MRRITLLLCVAIPVLAALDAFGQEGPSPSPALASEPVAEAEVDERPFTNNPNGAGLSVGGAEDALRAGTALTITFPADMVSPDKIDAEGTESPIDVWPALDADFVWRTQSQGELTVKGPLIPGQSYRFRLREGARDLAGNPFHPDTWGVEMTAPVLRATEEDYGERDSLNARPQVPIEFNYPIRLSDAASGVWFQDRASRQRFRVEYCIGQNDTVDGQDVSRYRVDFIIRQRLWRCDRHGSPNIVE